VGLNIGMQMDRTTGDFLYPFLSPLFAPAAYWS
jgi:hypothetical protein